MSEAWYIVRRHVKVVAGGDDRCIADFSWESHPLERPHGGLVRFYAPVTIP